MNRIDKKFRELKRRKEKAFIAYITAGDPGLSTTSKLTFALEKTGVDIIELGIPFSDPLADGPTIQAASQRALARGANLDKIFKMVSAVRNKINIPLVFMTYYNPVLRYGVSEFFKSCTRCGVDGVIIPDLPADEAGEIIRLGRRNRISTIFLVAPTSTKKRIADIARKSTGFIYYVSLTGVTGARSKLPAELKSKVNMIKSVTDKSVAVGFGVSNPIQARQVASAADGVIIGSAIVRIIAGKKDIIRKVSKFTESLAKAIHGK